MLRGGRSACFRDFVRLTIVLKPTARGVPCHRLWLLARHGQVAEAGAEVVCAARTPEQIDETVREIADGGRAIGVVTDVTDSAQVDHSMQPV